MAKTKYRKKTKNGTEYFFYRLRHKNLRSPKDIYGKTVKELDLKVKEINFELDRGITSEKAFFDVYLKRWLDSVHIVGKKGGTISNYYVFYDNYIKGSPIGKIQLRDVTALDIQEYYESLIDEKGINVIRAIHGMICPCLRYAFVNQKILVDFSRSISLPMVHDDIKKDNELKTLTIEEQEKFIEIIKESHFELLFLTGLNTELRIGELMALNWGDIDFEEKEVVVNKTLEYQKDKKTGKYGNRINTPKTKSGYRTVPIPDFLIPRLKEQKIRMLEKKMLLQNKYKDNNLVFYTNLGGFLNAKAVWTSLDNLLKKHNMRHFTLHSLRHTYATRLFELGENPKTVQILLGHSDISMTLNTYTHVLKAVSSDSGNKMNKLYNELSQ